MRWKRKRYKRSDGQMAGELQRRGTKRGARGGGKGKRRMILANRYN